MKKLTSVLLLGSALALSACGGDSDSSGSNDSYTSKFTSTISNGNKYSCPTKAALDTCKSDSQCKASKCTLTKKVTEPFDPAKTANCKVSGQTIYGQKNGVCKVSLSFLNNGQPSEVVCKANGTIVLSNGLQAGSGTINLNSRIFTCK